jgi:hypothetical protein
MNSRPKWFRPVAIVALLWNLLGCAAYLVDAMITPEQLNQLPEAQRALYEARPAWAVAGTATAVWFGAAGCLGLILLKRWSTWLLVLSLVGVVVQDLWLFGLGGAAGQAGAVALVLQGVVFLVSIGLVLLARRASAQGWLT